MNWVSFCLAVCSQPREIQEHPASLPSPGEECSAVPLNPSLLSGTRESIQYMEAEGGSLAPRTVQPCTASSLLCGELDTGTLQLPRCGPKQK